MELISMGRAFPYFPFFCSHVRRLKNGNCPLSAAL